MTTLSKQGEQALTSIFTTFGSASEFERIVALAFLQGMQAGKRQCQEHKE